MAVDRPAAPYGADLAFIHDSGFGNVARGAARTLFARLADGGLTDGLVVDLGCGGGTIVAAAVAAGYDALGVDISQLPLAGAAPEWYSEKAVAIGAYVVASGIFTVLGVEPPIFGSKNVVSLLADGLDGVVGAKFAVEPDPEAASVMIRRHIEEKRKALGLPFVEPSTIQVKPKVKAAE